MGGYRNRYRVWDGKETKSSDGGTPKDDKSLGGQSSATSGGAGQGPPAYEQPMFARQQIQILQAETARRSDAQKRARVCLANKQDSEEAEKPLSFGQDYVKSEPVAPGDDVTMGNNIVEPQPDRPIRVPILRRMNLAHRERPEALSPAASNVQSAPLAPPADVRQQRLHTFLRKKLSDAAENSLQGAANPFEEFDLTLQRFAGDVISLDWLALLRSARGIIGTVLQGLRRPMGAVETNAYNVVRGLLDGLGTQHYAKPPQDEVAALESARVSEQEKVGAAIAGAISLFSSVVPALAPSLEPFMKDILQNWADPAGANQDTPLAAKVGAILQWSHALPEHLGGLSEKAAGDVGRLETFSKRIIEEATSVDILVAESASLVNTVQDVQTALKKGFTELMRHFKSMYMELYQFPCVSGNTLAKQEFIAVFEPAHADLVRIWGEAHDGSVGPPKQNEFGAFYK